MNYSIHNSKTGEVIIQDISLPEDSVEKLSSDSPEGHFRAGSLEQLVEAGLDKNMSVYALVR